MATSNICSGNTPTVYRHLASAVIHRRNLLPKADAIRVAHVCDLFLDFSEKHHTPDSFARYKSFLRDFCDQYGAQPANSIKPFNVARSRRRTPSAHPRLYM